MIIDTEEPPELWQPAQEEDKDEEDDEEAWATEVFCINMLANQWARLANNVLYQFTTKLVLTKDPFSRIPEGWNDQNLLHELLWSGMTCTLCDFRLRTEWQDVRHRRSPMHLASEQWIQLKTKNIANWASLTSQVISVISYSTIIARKLILNHTVRSRLVLRAFEMTIRMR